jgi:hypothetical protein
LGRDVGFDLLWTNYNPRCPPPWTEAELRHKCEEADTVPFDKPRGRVSKLRDRIQEKIDAANGGAGGFSIAERIQQLTAYSCGEGPRPPDLPCPPGIDPAQRARAMQQKRDALESAFRSAVAKEMDGQPLAPDDFKPQLIACMPPSSPAIKDNRR